MQVRRVLFCGDRDVALRWLSDSQTDGQSVIDWLTTAGVATSSAPLYSATFGQPGPIPSPENRGRGSPKSVDTSI